MGLARTIHNNGDIVYDDIVYDDNSMSIIDYNKPKKQINKYTTVNTTKILK